MNLDIISIARAGGCCQIVNAVRIRWSVVYKEVLVHVKVLRMAVLLTVDSGFLIPQGRRYIVNAGIFLSVDPKYCQLFVPVQHIDC